MRYCGFLCNSINGCDKEKVMKNILKLIIAYWVVKHFVIDNDLIDKTRNRIRSEVKDFINA